MATIKQSISWAVIPACILFEKSLLGGRLDAKLWAYWAAEMAFTLVLWRLSTGAPWRDLPDRFGPWKTVYERFRAMRKNGLLDRIMARLQLTLNAAGLIDADLFCIDGTNARASRAAAGAAKKKSAARRAS